MTLTSIRLHHCHGPNLAIPANTKHTWHSALHRYTYVLIPFITANVTNHHCYLKLV